MVPASFLHNRVFPVLLITLWLMVACGGGGGGTQAPPPSLPSLISAFTTTQAVVPMGSSTSLSWGLDASVTSATLDGQPLIGSSGIATVTPKFRQSYTLVATDGKRTDTRVVKVAAQGLDLIAGDLGGNGCLDGIGREARFSWPWILASDPQGNLVVADPNFYSVRRVTPAGAVATIAGNPAETGYMDGPAGIARFGQIAGLAVAPDGTIYVVDFGNQKIRKIAVDGIVSTFVSFGQGGSGAFQYNPTLDASGNLYVSGYFSGKIQRITPSGVATEFSTGFTYPGDLTILPDGTLLVIETFGGTLWAVDADGTRTSVTLTFDPTDAQGGYISSIRALAADHSGGIYLSTSRLGLLYRDAAGLVHTVTGWKESKFLGGGFPYGLAWMNDRLALGVTNYGGEIATLLPGGQPASLAGWGGTLARVNGTTSTARFSNAYSLALGGQGDIYVVDTDSTGHFPAQVRRVGRDGAVSSLGLSVDLGYVSGQTPHPLPLGDGSVLFTGNQAIGKVTLTGDISSILGGASSGLGLDALSGICADAQGTIYFGENPWLSGNRQIRKLTSTGQLSVLAGNSAGIHSIAGVSFDPAGRILAADPSGQLVWGISLSGSATKLAGVEFNSGFLDGAFGTGRLKWPSAVSLHPSGQLLICDQGNFAIRALSSTGNLSTLGGAPDRQGVRLGSTNISFTNPSDMAVTTDGDLIITDGFAVLCWTAPFGN